MALFNFGKKKNEKRSPAPVCGCCCPTGEAKNEICCIKVLGAGCKSCHEMYENAKL